MGALPVNGRERPDPEGTPDPNTVTAWVKNHQALATIALLVVAGILGAIVFTTLSGGTDGPSISGTLRLTDWDSVYIADDGSCIGTGGYDDIRAGAQVRLTDQSGDVLQVSNLEGGIEDDSDGECMFEFFLDDVPDADFYSVEVSHRGEITSSREELEAEGWAFSLTLG